MPVSKADLIGINTEQAAPQRHLASNFVVKFSDAAAAATLVAAEKERNLRRMQQMAAASNMGILNPFVFNQFGTYGFAAAQVNIN